MSPKPPSKSNIRPTVFIACSVEGREVAECIQLELEHDASAEIWWQGSFGLMEGTLQSLLNALDIFDFAVFVARGDDHISSRNNSSNSMRDNVLFELGLFMGRHGPERALVVADGSSQLKIPSDLAGARLAWFNTEGKTSLQAALGPACTLLKQRIRKLGPSPLRRGQELTEAATSTMEINTTLRTLLETASTRKIGEFPSYISITADAISKAQSNITIACDFPAYGIFSDYSAYRRYYDALIHRASAGVRVSMIYGSKVYRQTRFREQFNKDWGVLASDASFSNRLSVLARRTSVVFKDKAQLESFILGEQDSLAESFGFAARHPVACLMPIFFWIIDQTHAIFAFPAFGEGPPEHGFETRDASLIQVFAIIAKKYEGHTIESEKRASVFETKP